MPILKIQNGRHVSCDKSHSGQEEQTRSGWLGDDEHFQTSKKDRTNYRSDLMFLGQKNEVKRSSNVLYFTGEIILIRGMLNSICTISKTIKTSNP